MSELTDPSTRISPVFKTKGRNTETQKRCLEETTEIKLLKRLVEENNSKKEALITKDKNVSIQLCEYEFEGGRISKRKLMIQDVSGGSFHASRAPVVPTERSEPLTKRRRYQRRNSKAPHMFHAAFQQIAQLSSSDKPHTGIASTLQKVEKLLEGRGPRRNSLTPPSA